MTPNHPKSPTVKLITLTAGVIVSTGLLYGSFKWGVYYARNTSNEKVLSKDERGVTITEASVKVMHGPDMVPFAIWHKDYLYTPDTAMMELIGGSRHP
jgi:hypothetical protein